MRCSLNELESLCERAALAAGLPDGCDIDVAAQTAWLAGHDFPVLSGLLTELECLSGGLSLGLSLDVLQQGTLNLSARPGCAMAGLLLDLLIARSFAGEAEASLRVTALRNPLYLLAAFRCASRMEIRLLTTLRAEGGPEEIVLFLTAAGDIRLWADRDALAAATDGRTSFQGEIAVDRGQFGQFRRPSAPPDLEQEELGRCYARILAEGVLVEDRHWRALKSLGQHRLVPPSDLSRRGAGAGLTDND